MSLEHDAALASSEDEPHQSAPATRHADEFDFIVVGSGAGGGPLAANLARNGYTVLLLEAGSATENAHYSVPGFHGLATEDPELRWDYFVKHYEEFRLRVLDTKYTKEQDGVLYPRAGTLGGCTAHNAMITLVPHDSDWDHMANLTGDPSWLAANMHRYFERLENCGYVSAPGTQPRTAWLRLIDRLRRVAALPPSPANPSGHGYQGWLNTSLADPELALPDKDLLKLFWKAIRRAVARGIELTPLKLLRVLLTRGVQHFDPNDQREKRSPEGLYFTPLATRQGKRNGAREYIRQIEKEFPAQLTVRTQCLVTRVLFDGAAPPRALGVEYLEGEHLYRADPQFDANARFMRMTAFARHDVVLAAGAYNSPQLLMLSGIGPREELQRHGIPVRVDLPGVGRNLQDRYEVGVVTEMARDFVLLGQNTFAPPVGATPERAWAEWLKGKGLYTSNGAVIGISLRSSRQQEDPDLFIIGLPGHFRGYYPGYSKDLLNKRNRFTWAVLKAHTRNSGGRVTLRSSNPRDVPEIVFHYFEEGTAGAAEDLEAVVEGVLFARSIMKTTSTMVRSELVPGPNVRTREQIRDFIRKEAWGHHASCSNRMGPRTDPFAVVDSRFRVHGVRGLRVVDASVFPRIPGFFIVTAVYMISEKASDVLLKDAALQRALKLVVRGETTVNR
ncbi:MAG: GMC family oxidoreductase [Longimicrobiales bacterium]